MNTQPEKGSSASFSWHSWARESIPFRPSTGSIATSTRICGVIWIIVALFAKRATTPPVQWTGSVPMDAHLETAWRLELDPVFVNSRWCRTHQFDESRLGLSPSRSGRSIHLSFEFAIVQPQRVCHGIDAVAPGQFYSRLPQ